MANTTAIDCIASTFEMIVGKASHVGARSLLPVKKNKHVCMHIIRYTLGRNQLDNHQHVSQYVIARKHPRAQVQVEKMSASHKFFLMRSTMFAVEMLACIVSEGCVSIIMFYHCYLPVLQGNAWLIGQQYHQCTTVDMFFSHCLINKLTLVVPIYNNQYFD